MTSASDEKKNRGPGATWRGVSHSNGSVSNTSQASVFSVPRSSPAGSSTTRSSTLTSGLRPSAVRSPQTAQPLSEPVTAVVRKVSGRPVSKAPASVPRERPSQIEARKPRSTASTRQDLPAAKQKAAWSCLEWQPAKVATRSLSQRAPRFSEPAPASREPEPSRASAAADELASADNMAAPELPELSLVSLSASGKLLSSTRGKDDELLAETVAFTHRLATLTARAFGFRKCRALCMRSPASAIIVTEREGGEIVGVAGSIANLREPLKALGLE